MKNSNFILVFVMMFFVGQLCDAKTIDEIVQQSLLPKMKKNVSEFFYRRSSSKYDKFLLDNQLKLLDSRANSGHNKTFLANKKCVADKTEILQLKSYTGNNFYRFIFCKKETDGGFHPASNPHYEMPPDCFEQKESWFFDMELTKTGSEKINSTIKIGDSVELITAVPTKTKKKISTTSEDSKYEKKSYKVDDYFQETFDPIEDRAEVLLTLFRHSLGEEADVRQSQRDNYDGESRKQKQERLNKINLRLQQVSALNSKVRDEFDKLIAGSDAKDKQKLELLKNYATDTKPSWPDISKMPQDEQNLMIDVYSKVLFAVHHPCSPESESASHPTEKTQGTATVVH